MRTVNDYITPEQVKVSSVYSGYQVYHGESRLGDIAVVQARDNGGSFTFLPPSITIDGEQFFLTKIITTSSNDPGYAARRKLYFRPWSDEEVKASFDQDEPAPGVRPVDNTSCVVCGQNGCRILGGVK